MVGKSSGKAPPNRKLREARQERGWRLKDVVAAVQSLEAGFQNPRTGSLGLDENTVSRWERGVIQPTDFYKARLCVAFDVEQPAELAWDASPRLLAEIEDVKRRAEPSALSNRATGRQRSEVGARSQPEGDSDGSAGVGSPSSGRRGAGYYPSSSQQTWRTAIWDACAFSANGRGTR